MQRLWIEKQDRLLPFQEPTDLVCDTLAVAPAVHLRDDQRLADPHEGFVEREPEDVIKLVDPAVDVQRMRVNNRAVDLDPALDQGGCQNCRLPERYFDPVRKL